jgi:pristinamycin I synthase 3 and 4
MPVDESSLRVAPRTERSSPARLSYAQQSIWIVDRIQGQSTEYNSPYLFRCVGELSVEALREGMAAIVERHEILRTRFVEGDHEPVQIVIPAHEVSLPVVDLGSLPAEARADRVEEELSNAWNHRFDLRRGPMMTGTVIALAPREFLLLLTFHHIVFDGWSLGIFCRALNACYEGYPSGRKNATARPAVQYADYAEWQRSASHASSISDGLAYWRQQLADAPDCLEPRVGPRSAVIRSRSDADTCSFVIDADALATLKSVSRRHGATLYTTLLMAFAVVVARFERKDDILIGSPAANRPKPELLDVIGVFANLLALRVQVDRGMRLRDLLDRMRATVIDAQQFQHVPFQHVVKAVAPARRFPMPLVEVVFAFQSGLGMSLQLPGVEVHRLVRGPKRLQFNMVVSAVETNGELCILWSYKRDTYDRARIERMCRAYRRIVDVIAADDDLTVGDLPLDESTLGEGTLDE